MISFVALAQTATVTDLKRIKRQFPGYGRQFGGFPPQQGFQQNPQQPFGGFNTFVFPGQFPGQQEQFSQLPQGQQIHPQIQNQGQFNQQQPQQGQFNQQQPNQGQFNQQRPNQGQFNQQNPNQGQFNQQNPNQGQFIPQQQQQPTTPATTVSPQVQSK